MKERIIAAKEIEYTLAEFLDKLQLSGKLEDIYFAKDEDTDDIIRGHSMLETVRGYA